MNLVDKKSKSNFLLFDDVILIRQLYYHLWTPENIFIHNVVYFSFFSGHRDDIMKLLFRVSKLLVIWETSSQ